jgi:hypothetical protein
LDFLPKPLGRLDQCHKPACNTRPFQAQGAWHFGKEGVRQSQPQ